MHRFLRKKITRAFRELRERGYFARQSWMCCQSCGCAALPEDKYGRFVFYHAQNRKDLIRDGRCFLTWEGDGHEIVNVLRKHGLGVEWNGDRRECILIKEVAG